MPTYSGTARTSTYLRKRKMREGAKNNMTITSFWAPKPRARDTANDPQNESGSPSEPSPTSTSDIDITSESIDDIPTFEIQQEAAHPFLDMTADDDDNHDFTEPTPVIDTVKKLIIEAKKFKSFTSLVHLHALKQFIELWDKYKRNPRIKAPMMKSSRAVAVSIGKGPYMARKIRTLYKYVARFHTLPPVSAGKHHGHPSLLNNERIAQAVRRYLTVLSDGEVSQPINEYCQWLVFLIRTIDNTTALNETSKHGDNPITRSQPQWPKDI